MLSEAQVQQFHRDGYLNAGPVLDPDTVAVLSAALDGIIATGPEGFAPDAPRPVLFRDLTRGGPYGQGGARPVWQIVNIWEASPPFRALLAHPMITRAIGQLTRACDLQVWHDQVQYKPAESGGATPWHQDAPLWPSIEPMTEVTAWIPFDDAEIANGCMWMVPGSHLWGNRIEHLRTLEALRTLPAFAEVPAPDSAAPLAARPCPVKRGEVHFHHALTWHGSPENHSPNPRRAIAIHYMTPEARFTGQDHPMRPFISVAPGESMRHAGPHFPMVLRDGAPLNLP